MKRARFTGVVLVALAGCGKPSSAPPPAPAAAPTPTHYIGDWFEVADGRCRIERAQRTLLEQRAGEGRVAEDVLMVDTRWSCVDASERAVDVARLLPRDAALAWIDDRRAVHLRSPRRGAPNHIYFAVPTEHDGLRRTRRYAPESAEPDGPRERGEARLTLTDAAGVRRVVVAPWRREHDAALDTLLDRLLQSLAHGEPAPGLVADATGEQALIVGSALYRQALATFAPQRVAVREVEQVEGQLRAVLVLERSTIETAQASAFELAFELDAARERVLRVLDPVRIRSQLDCVTERKALVARSDVRGSGPRCNVIGSLLAGRCDEVEREAMAHALRVGAACSDLEAVAIDAAEPLAVPPDFSVHLRRARSLASLDRSPRYQLELRADGSLSFFGEHWVSQLGAGVGRTAPHLLGALYAAFLRAGWFEREEPDPRRCPRDDRGDTLRLRAGGRERSVRDREGCRASFTARELDGLRRAVERVSGVDAWIQPRARPGKDTDQIWVVAAE